jgi:hypothetical protein
MMEPVPNPIAAAAAAAEFVTVKPEPTAPV